MLGGELLLPCLGLLPQRVDLAKIVAGGQQGVLRRLRLLFGGFGLGVRLSRCRFRQRERHGGVFDQQAATTALECAVAFGSLGLAL